MLQENYTLSVLQSNLTCELVHYFCIIMQNLKEFFSDYEARALILPAIGLVNRRTPFE